MFEFTKNELRDLVIAFIVLSIAFAIANVKFDLHAFISILPIVMFGVGVGFLLHELGHKYVANKYGYKAEFKLWPIGLLIALITSLIGWVFALPGEAKITAENIDEETTGKIAIAGPMANIGLGLLFIVIAAITYPLKSSFTLFELIYLVSTVGFSVNAFLATFNILPFYTLDGTKVMKWSVKAFIVAFAIAAIMMLSSMFIGAENMILMLIGS
ncbi:peptidase M50 family [Methanobrevibacter ruminantium M1]|uniref:Peptidase M50 family n=1 Tax=Methanobrevibacter ruminantium (strain ATCC 35063 / DSM 1093 / JCM 13430 / OCM 146 / M1) TaxID=634498 RepID=D3DYZ8_METRM|nr:site-2 protease family protein [Methanobrevibacter ruminantium]ADC47548.1 peptidase M50 family [Methanobrevibacter ruminantium M1]